MIPATTLHASAMAAIHAGAFPPGERWDEATFACLLQTPGALGLLDPRGGLVLTRHAGGEAEILTVGVLPGSRRQGVARDLLRAALAGLSGPAFLEGAAGNTAALGLYGALGFVECGRRRGYYGAGRDALVLRFNAA